MSEPDIPQSHGSILVFGWSVRGDSFPPLGATWCQSTRPVGIPACAADPHNSCRWQLPPQSCSWGTPVVFCTQHCSLIRLQPPTATQQTSKSACEVEAEPHRVSPTEDHHPCPISPGFQPRPNRPSPGTPAPCASSHPGQQTSPVAAATSAVAAVGWGHASLAVCTGPRRVDGNGCWVYGIGGATIDGAHSSENITSPQGGCSAGAATAEGLGAAELAIEGRQREDWSHWRWLSLPHAAGAVVQLSAGEAHNLALDAAGGVWAWGSNTDGQCGGTTGPFAGQGQRADRDASGDWDLNTSPSDAEMAAVAATNEGPGLSSQPTPVVHVAIPIHVWQVACGARHSLAVDRNGGVWAWGWNAYGQCGVAALAGGGAGSRAVLLAPVRVQGGALGGVPCRAVAAGLGHSLALTEAGQVAAWGWNDAGQCGPAESLAVGLGQQSNDGGRGDAATAATPSFVSEPRLVRILRPTAAIAPACCVGSAGSGQRLGASVRALVSEPVTDDTLKRPGELLEAHEPSGADDVKRSREQCGGCGLAAGSDALGKHVVGVGVAAEWSGVVAAKGSGAAGSPGGADSVPNLRLHGAEGALEAGQHEDMVAEDDVDEEEDIVKISCGGRHSLALTPGGALYGWGSNTLGQLGPAVPGRASTTPRLLLPAVSSTQVSFDSAGSADKGPGLSRRSGPQGEVPLSGYPGNTEAARQADDLAGQHMSPMEASRTAEAPTTGCCVFLAAERSHEGLKLGTKGSGGVVAIGGVGTARGAKLHQHGGSSRKRDPEGSLVGVTGSQAAAVISRMLTGDLEVVDMEGGWSHTVIRGGV